MQKEAPPKIKTKLNPRKRTSIVAVVVVGVLVLLAILLMQRPERSVASYCKVYNEEKTRLSAMSNNSNPYPSGLFNVSVTDAAQIATSLGRLDRVAPKEIEPMLSSLQKLYQDIHDNPSHAINNSLNGGSLDDNLKAWTKGHCSN